MLYQKTSSGNNRSQCFFSAVVLYQPFRACNCLLLKIELTILSSDSPTSGDFIESVRAPDLSADEGEIVSGKSDWFKDALHEFGVKEVDELISALAIFITERFTEVPTEEKMKGKTAQHMIPQNCEVLQVKTTNMLRGRHKKIDMRLTALLKNISKATIAIVKAADALTRQERRDEQ